MVSALVIKTTGEISEVDVEAGGSVLANLYREIGCTVVEPVQLTDDLCLWLDEEGLLTKEPFNAVATTLAGLHGYVHQPYVGHAVLVRTTDDGDSANLTAEQFGVAVSMLSDIKALLTRR